MCLRMQNRSEAKSKKKNLYETTMNGFVFLTPICMYGCFPEKLKYKCKRIDSLQISRLHSIDNISSIKMKVLIVLLYFCYLSAAAIPSSNPMKDALDAEWNKLKSLLPVDPLKLNSVNQTWCTCGVFLSGQFKKGSGEPPKGPAALMHEQDTKYACTPLGAKQCSNKCLETVNYFYVLSCVLVKLKFIPFY